MLLLAACAPRAASGDALLAAAQHRTQSEVPAEVAPEELKVWATAPSDPEALRPRPADAPDVAVIAFSGHCGLLCRARNTWSYLDESSDATDGVAVLAGIVRAFERQGLTVEAVSLSSFVEAHPSRISGEIELGYLEGQAYLDYAKRRWIDGVENPTRVVLVGHSHGTVWATLLAMNNLDVGFDYLVSIDAICWQWWAKHKGHVSRAYVEAGLPIPFPLEQGDPCGTLAVPGQRGRYDINDVVPANVAYGLEIRTPFRIFSLDPNVLYDDDVNVRINGSVDNIWGIEATVAHNGVGRSYSPAVAWVGTMIDLLGLPEPGAFPMMTFVRPPLPTGFDYQRE
jgi:hypothetical protein